MCNTGQVSGPPDTCVVVPASDGTACDDGQFCTTGDVCASGACAGGAPNECGIAPGPCGDVICVESSKSCSVTPVDDGSPCAPSNPCQVDGACHAGACVGVAKDCTVGLQACQVGACAMNGTCVTSPAPDGSACNDHDACTQGDACLAGACVGTPITGCHLYRDEGFETCPDGWTLSGDWQCGAPMNVGPPTAHTGNNCIATQIAGDYHDNDSFLTSTADSPPIDLTQATNPQISFWAWVSTDSGDGFNLKVSTDGGQTFTGVATVTPAYPLLVAGQPAWGGDSSAEGWQPYSADLTAYAGQSILLRFAFSSDAAVVDPGVYIDDVVVAEPPQIPLYITTTSPLLDAHVGSSVLGADHQGRRHQRLGVEQGHRRRERRLAHRRPGDRRALGHALGGAGGARERHRARRGADVSLELRGGDVHLQGRARRVLHELRGRVPGRLDADRRLAVRFPGERGPHDRVRGPAVPRHAGNSASDYSDNQTFAGTTAISPAIDLAGMQSPTLTFRMWVYTEGSIYDGFNLQISDRRRGRPTRSSTTSCPAVQPADGRRRARVGW